MDRSLEENVEIKLRKTIELSTFLTSPFNCIYFDRNDKMIYIGKIFEPGFSPKVLSYSFNEEQNFFKVVLDYENDKMDTIDNIDYDPRQNIFGG